MRRGVSLSPRTPPDMIAELARSAEALGYDSFWLTHPPGSDGIAALAPAARATTTINLGLGVVPLHGRAATDIADSVLDIPNDASFYMQSGRHSDVLMGPLLKLR